MAHKITKYQVLNLFEEKEVLTKPYVLEKLGCSSYALMFILEDLIDDDLVRRCNYGYKLNKDWVAEEVGIVDARYEQNIYDHRGRIVCTVFGSSLEELGINVRRILRTN